MASTLQYPSRLHDKHVPAVVSFSAETPNQESKKREPVRGPEKKSRERKESKSNFASSHIGRNISTRKNDLASSLQLR
jgi:hypothetical protein